MWSKTLWNIRLKLYIFYYRLPILIDYDWMIFLEKYGKSDDFWNREYTLLAMAFMNFFFVSLTQKYQSSTWDLYFRIDDSCNTNRFVIFKIWNSTETSIPWLIHADCRSVRKWIKCVKGIHSERSIPTARQIHLHKVKINQMPKVAGVLKYLKCLGHQMR